MQLTQKLHVQHWRSIEGIPAQKALKATKGSFKLEDLSGVHSQRRPLPKQIAEQIARHAITNKGRVSKRPLLHALFAYYERKTPEAVRGIIERAEGDYPKLVF